MVIIIINIYIYTYTHTYFPRGFPPSLAPPPTRLVAHAQSPN